MARLIDLNHLTSTSPSIPKLLEGIKTRKSNGFKKTGDTVQITRRMALGFAVSIGLTGIFGERNASLAQDNGFWIDGPLPIPPIYNKITNEQTGTRSFLKRGVYVAEIGTKGRMYRVKKNAFDLLAMEDLIGPDTLNYVKKYLRLKSTFLFYDFDNLISVAASEDKQPLTDLANKLFDNFEKLEDASSCLISIFHGTPAVFLASRAVFSSHSRSFSSANTATQNTVLDFSVSYFLVDLIHYIIFYLK